MAGNQIIDRRTVAIPGPTGDVTPAALAAQEAAEEARGGAERARDTAEQYASDVVTIQDATIAAQASTAGTLTHDAVSAIAQATQVASAIVVGAASMTVTGGSPVLQNLASSSTIIPTWAMPDDAPSSVTTIIPSLPTWCRQLRVEAILARADESTTEFTCLRAIATPLISNTAWETTQRVSSIYYTGLPAANSTLRVSVEVSIPIPVPSAPVSVSIVRETADVFDERVGNVYLLGIFCTPLPGPSPAATVAPADAYNSWPMIFSTGNQRLLCVYASGTQHSFIDPTRKLLSRTSDDGGVTWSAPSTLLNTSGDDSATGRGRDGSGNLLLWTRTSYVFSLRRSTDGGATWALVSTPSWTSVPTHIGDIVILDDGTLLAFWDSGSRGWASNNDNAWGIITSSDEGATWSQTTIESALGVDEAPVEISGVVFSGSGVLALGRCDSGANTSNSGLFRIKLMPNGSFINKRRTNIFDQFKSTPSLILDDGVVHAYWYRRMWGDVRHRAIPVNRLWADWGSRLWPESDIVAGGYGKIDADAGNANAVKTPDGKHYVAFYAGNATKCSVLCQPA